MPPLYEITPDHIRALPRTTFRSAAMTERHDLQRLLRDQISIVDPDVLVIAEEFGEWTDSRRRIDLLGIDRDANLVVIELKRTEDGGHMELQALRYAAMVSTLTSGQAVDIYARYLQRRGLPGDAEQRLKEHLEVEEFDEDAFAQDVRILLVAADFSRELTTAVLWLHEKFLDIRCVRLNPYDDDGRVLIDVQQVLPLPEASEYQVQVREKRTQERASRSGQRDTTRYDITLSGVLHAAQAKRNGILLVVKALHAEGVPMEELLAHFTQAGQGHAFYSVPGLHTNEPAFLEAATHQTRPFRPKRYHTGPEDFFPCGNRTYVFSNQWGPSWQGMMDALGKAYPQLRLQVAVHP